MNLKAKVYAQHHKQVAQNSLSARIALLESKGTAPAAIQKDAVVRKLKAAIRASNRRLAGVAAQEKLNAQKLKHKEEKAVAKKNAADPAAAQSEPKAPKTPKAPKPKKEKKAK